MGVILKISERIAPVDIVNIRFKEEQIVLVKHAALTDHYLRVDSAKEITLTCVDTRDLESCEYFLSGRSLTLGDTWTLEYHWRYD